jgi:hypothetical protein
MAQTRMFRDRVVSMEQTLEGGEKHLPLLKELCREALPGWEYAEHALDHERDLFVMDLRGPDGGAKRIAWTRMVLFDAERIPTLTGDPASQLRAKIVDFLRARAAKPEIVVTFRHLEEGWVDTPEPRREGGGRRRRRGGRGARGGERGGQDRRPGAPPSQAQGGERRPGGARPSSGASQRPGARPPSGAPQRPGGPPAAPPANAGGENPPEGAGKRRRRFRRRRRGGRGGGGGQPGSGSSGPAPNPGGGGGPRP